MDQETHYRVVRYFDQWPIGRKKEIIRSGLSFEEALRAFDSQDRQIANEDIAIENESTGQEVSAKKPRTEKSPDLKRWED